MWLYSASYSKHAQRAVCSHGIRGPAEIHKGSSALGWRDCSLLPPLQGQRKSIECVCVHTDRFFNIMWNFLFFFFQDKKEPEASLTLGLTLRGIQIFQVCCVYIYWVRLYTKLYKIQLFQIIHCVFLCSDGYILFFRMWALSGNSCMIFPGPMWGNWCLWSVLQCCISMI